MRAKHARQIRRGIMIAREVIAGERVGMGRGGSLKLSGLAYEAYWREMFSDVHRRLRQIGRKRLCG